MKDRGRKNYVLEAVEALCAGDVATPIRERGGPSQKKTLRRLEELRKNMLEREVREAKIVEQNKLAIASVAHDIKTPLALIAGYTECLGDGIDDKDYLALIGEKTEQINQLVLKLVDTSQQEINEIPKLRDLVDARYFFSAVLEKYADLAKAKNITYKVRRIPNAKIYVNRQDMERVIQNLVTNAIKYTEPGGKVVVSFTRWGVYLLVTVRDNGRGISKRSLPYVFDKFYREDHSRTDLRSSGLGLYIAKDIAKKHGGDITVRSREGKGSLFTLSIPEVSNSGKLAQRFEALPRPVKLCAENGARRRKEEHIHIAHRHTFPADVPFRFGGGFHQRTRLQQDDAGNGLKWNALPSIFRLCNGWCLPTKKRTARVFAPSFSVRTESAPSGSRPRKRGSTSLSRANSTAVGSPAHTPLLPRPRKRSATACMS